MTEMRDRLAGVELTVAAKAVQILDALRALGHPAFVAEGVRSIERQKALYAQGRTTPGRIVTNANGTHLAQCTHSPQADGYGHAVDFAFQGGSDPWDEAHPWALLGAMAQALGLTWGGAWKAMGGGDRGHVELKP